MQSFGLVEMEGNEVKLLSIFGKQKILKARLKLYVNK